MIIEYNISRFQQMLHELMNQPTYCLLHNALICRIEIDIGINVLYYKISNIYVGLN